MGEESEKNKGENGLKELGLALFGSGLGQIFKAIGQEFELDGKCTSTIENYTQIVCVKHETKEIDQTKIQENLKTTRNAKTTRRAVPGPWL